jgi:hypothetical protein
MNSLKLCSQNQKIEFGMEALKSQYFYDKGGIYSLLAFRPHERKMLLL